MVNVFDVKGSALVRLAAERLKPMMDKPAYIDYVKSGANKERVPNDPDFWYTRSASILRQVYLNGPIGVEQLRTRYGSRKEHTMHRKHHVKAGGGIIRDAFQSLEKINLVKNTKSGRVITPKGKSFLDKLSKEIETGAKRTE